jgi:hypothetical protein
MFSWHLQNPVSSRFIFFIFFICTKFPGHGVPGRIWTTHTRYGPLRARTPFMSHASPRINARPRLPALDPSYPPQQPPRPAPSSPRRRALTRYAFPFFPFLLSETEDLEAPDLALLRYTYWLHFCLQKSILC